MPMTQPLSATSTGGSSYYSEKYFSWQAPIGEFGGWANVTKFRDFIKPSDRLIDYGCGGGYLLSRIECAERVGIEINPAARETARGMGIRAVGSAAEIADGWADVIISNHALEHTTRPLDELKDLLPKLKVGGKAVFFVPCESIRCAYRPGDVNQHLYSWSPMNLGNLFTLAGFRVETVEPFLHKWPRRYRFWSRFGRGVFDCVSRIYARWERTWFQVRVIAYRPAP